MPATGSNRYLYTHLGLAMRFLYVSSYSRASHRNFGRRNRRGGIGRHRKSISTALLDEVAVGDYVIVHVGYALERLNVAEAEETLRLFAELAASVADEPVLPVRMTHPQQGS